jgi:hypothetical protein
MPGADRAQALDQFQVLRQLRLVELGVAPSPVVLGQVGGALTRHRIQTL